MSETFESFKRRVVESTGFELRSMQIGTQEDLIGGHIFCSSRHGKVVAVGYPSYQDDGNPVWEQIDSFRFIPE